MTHLNNSCSLGLKDLPGAMNDRDGGERVREIRPGSAT